MTWDALQAFHQANPDRSILALFESAAGRAGAFSVSALDMLFDYSRLT